MKVPAKFREYIWLVETIAKVADSGKNAQTKEWEFRLFAFDRINGIEVLKEKFNMADSDDIHCYIKKVEVNISIPVIIKSQL